MRRIDPKYIIVREEILNLSGVPVPEDEPLILFRARDRNALQMLREYRRLCVIDNCNDFHLAGIDNRIREFGNFANEHPERMKQPGVTKGK